MSRAVFMFTPGRATAAPPDVSAHAKLMAGTVDDQTQLATADEPESGRLFQRCVVIVDGPLRSTKSEKRTC